jgi:enoyl-[acyl-carrier protein] reductase I
MLLEGKQGLIFGVANKRSIAWAIAQALHREGCALAFTYQGERVEPMVRELAASIGSSLVLPCDVTSDEQLDAVFAAVDREWGGLDLLVHSIGYAPSEELGGRFTDTNRKNFLLTMEISAYSLPAMVRRAEPLMERRGGGAVVTLTYLASERPVPRYNVMGVAKAALESSMRYLASELGQKNIRVNAISAGPLRTLAARSISGFTDMEEVFRQRNPMRRSIEQSEVGDAALFLLSPLARGITGEVLFVDAGYNIMGM